ncbi:MAG: hypothetical protein LBE20_00380, partial [Deltaproteobacteria bacterium]|nr:hypothetical protein [Deltaproteobacteria bacterium]
FVTYSYVCNSSSGTVELSNPSQTLTYVPTGNLSDWSVSNDASFSPNTVGSTSLSVTVCGPAGSGFSPCKKVTFSPRSPATQYGSNTDAGYLAALADGCSESINCSGVRLFMKIQGEWNGGRHTYALYARLSEVWACKKLNNAEGGIVCQHSIRNYTYPIFPPDINSFFGWGIDDVGSADFFILTGITKQVVSKEWLITNGYTALTTDLINYSHLNSCFYNIDISSLNCDNFCGKITQEIQDPYNIDIDIAVYDFSDEI